MSRRPRIRSTTHAPAGKGEQLRSSRRVLSYEVDGFGHVNNAIYLQYLEGARMDFMWQKGLAYEDFSRWRRYPVVARASLEFKAPARADDELEIVARISSSSAISFTLQYEVIRTRDCQLVLRAETVHVFVDENGRPIRIPEEFAARFISAGS